MSFARSFSNSPFFFRSLATSPPFFQWGTPQRNFSFQPSTPKIFCQSKWGQMTTPTPVHSLCSPSSHSLTSKHFAQPSLLEFQNRRFFHHSLFLLDEKETLQEEAPKEKVLDKPNMFAVVLVGGKQYKVVPGDLIVVEKMEAPDVGQNIYLQKVLIIGTTEYTAIGCPRITTAKVLAQVEEQTLSKKVLVFKKKRRKGYRRNRGVRQPITTLRILNVDLDPKEEYRNCPSTVFREHQTEQSSS